MIVYSRSCISKGYKAESTYGTANSFPLIIRFSMEMPQQMHNIEQEDLRPAHANTYIHKIAVQHLPVGITQVD